MVLLLTLIPLCTQQETHLVELFAGPLAQDTWLEQQKIHLVELFADPLCRLSEIVGFDAHTFGLSIQLTGLGASRILAMIPVGLTLLM